MAGKSLRVLLDNKERLVMPGAYNAFLARQIAQAGFSGVYVSGAGLSNSLGVPDNGTLGLEDFIYVGRWIVKSVDIPVICDADTGFQNITLTMKKYIEAGFSGLHIEDQVFPKRCGHLPGKEVIPRKEMVDKIKEACRVRDQLNPEFIIIARTDARGADNIDEDNQFNESAARGLMYLEAGADMIFPESLKSKEEFALYRKAVPGYLFANMTEFGETPFMTANEFFDLGYSIVVFPVSLFRYHAGQTIKGIEMLKYDGNQKNLVKEMMHRTAINALLNYKPGI
jgi:methylisocitrate lyase